MLSPGVAGSVVHGYGSPYVQSPAGEGSRTSSQITDEEEIARVKAGLGTRSCFKYTDDSPYNSPRKDHETLYCHEQNDRGRDDLIGSPSDPREISLQAHAKHRRDPEKELLASEHSDISETSKQSHWPSADVTSITASVSIASQKQWDWSRVRMRMAAQSAFSQTVLAKRAPSWSFRQQRGDSILAPMAVSVSVKMLEHEKKCMLMRPNADTCVCMYTNVRSRSLSDCATISAS